MFTIKSIVNNVVLLQEVENPVIALPESETWNQVVERLVECNNREHDYLASLPVEETVGKSCYSKTGDWKELGGYDYLEVHPQMFTDGLGLVEMFPEEMIESRRPKFWLNQAIAILVLDAESPERGALNDNKWTKGTFYQFIYPGDSVFIMNSAGATIHTVR